MLLPLSHYGIALQLAILGVGTFGRVKLVTHTKDNDRPYALKCMRKGQVIALKQVEHVMNEKRLLARDEIGLKQRESDLGKVLTLA